MVKVNLKAGDIVCFKDKPNKPFEIYSTYIANYHQTPYKYRCHLYDIKNQTFLESDYEEDKLELYLAEFI